MILSSIKYKNAGCILVKYLRPGMSVVINSSKSVLQHPLSSLCSIQGMTHGLCGFLLLGGGGGDGNAGWAGAGFCCLLCLEIIMY